MNTDEDRVTVILTMAESDVDHLSDLDEVWVSAPGDHRSSGKAWPATVRRWGSLPDLQCICGPDYTGEAPDMRSDCPVHGVAS